MAGLSSAGLEILRLADILEEIRAKLQAVFGAGVRFDDASPEGQLAGIFAEREALIWELVERVYNARFPSGAGGVQLDRLFQLAGLPRKGAKKSAVTATLTGDADTVVGAGSVATVGVDGARFVLLADVTIEGSGTDGDFEAEETGATQVPSGSLDTIATPVSGWTGISNALDGVVGRTIESDADYRRRGMTSVSTVAGSSAPALTATLFRIPDVDEVLIVENRFAYPDANGRPPNSFESVVLGGDAAAIAAAIWAAGPAGIRPYGTTTTYTADKRGDLQAIGWSRPVEVPIYAEVDVTTTDGYPLDGDDQIEEAVLEYGTGLGLGKPPIPIQALQRIETPGLYRLEVRFGKTADGTTANPVILSKTERAVFDSSRFVLARL